MQFQITNIFFRLSIILLSIILQLQHVNTKKVYGHMRTMKILISLRIRGGGGREVQRYRVFYVTGASNWYRLNSWARPAILVAGKGREGNVFISSVSSLSFLFLFLPVPLFHLTYYLFCLFTSFFWETIHNGPQGLFDLSLNPNTIKNPLSLISAFVVNRCFLQNPKIR